MNSFFSKILCLIGCHSWRDGPGFPCTECGEPDSVWHFESDDGKYIDECTKCRYTKWWCDDEEDAQSQQDCKNSLKNDY